MLVVYWASLRSRWNRVVLCCLTSYRVRWAQQPAGRRVSNLLVRGPSRGATWSGVKERSPMLTHSCLSLAY